MSSLLDIQHLTVSFDGHAVVRDLSLRVERGTTLCLVGESGSGKSMTAFSILRLIPSPGYIENGNIFFEGNDLLPMDETSLCHIRGRDVAMIFQEPMTSLNPVLRIGQQVAEPLRTHLGLSRKEAQNRTAELLRMVGIPAAESRLDDYPHQLSGGMRQRVMIAMALACGPRLLLADEPTTALDVTIQGQILHLMRQLAEESDMGLLLITHDLGVVADMADTVAVMYAGDLVEQAPAPEFFQRACHPYSLGLMDCAPGIAQNRKQRLNTIAGTVPSAAARPAGCAFRPRCPRSSVRCHSRPPVVSVEADHFVRCWLFA